MSATYRQTNQQTPLSNIHNGDTNTSTGQPSGPCNFRNLKLGGNAPKCGCLRFTSTSTGHPGSNTPVPRPGWCACEHHSCFHSHDPVDGHGVSGALVVEERQLPRRSSHESPQLQRLQNWQTEAEVGWAENEVLPGTQQDDFIQFGISIESLPAIPSQCLLPSDNGSRASSSQAERNRPFGGLGLNNFRPAANSAHITKHPPAMRGMQIYHDSNGQAHFQSPTEVATPSRCSSQDLGADIAYAQHIEAVGDILHTISEEKESAMTGVIEKVPTGSIKVQNESSDRILLPDLQQVDYVADYLDVKRNHEQRLEQLENASFTNYVTEDIRDQHELLETRVNELEVRMNSLEDHNLYGTSTAGSVQNANASIDSRSSSALVGNVESSRIEALESQLLELQAIAPPSQLRPWEVEVVFLPYGPNLMGIWSTKHTLSQRSRVSSASGDERTQSLQNRTAGDQARLTTYYDAISWDTAIAEIDAEYGQSEPWLTARACGAGSRVDERLRSRGLIKKIQVKGPDARDVQTAMISAFGNLPDTLAQDPYTGRDMKTTRPRPLAKFIGLQVPWIPLRKDHKISSLRFLNVAEMITPALWSVNFLSSSVAMRSNRLRRLYVTHPDAYIQHLGSTASWTWQKLRQLDRVYPDADSRVTPEADAEEPCWAFDERYDTIPSVYSSFASHHSLSIRQIAHEVEPTSPSDHFSSTPASPAASTTPTSLPPQSARPISPLRERHPFRPPIHSRTTSMPLVRLKSSPSQSSKRPMASYEPEANSSPAYVPISLHISKRHRTRSPSRPRDTPRWSTGPPSPHAEEIHHKRGTTPFAYATPHSNGPYIDNYQGGSNSESGDEGEDCDNQGSATDNNSDLGEEHNTLSSFDADEWEGVRDEQEHYLQNAGAVANAKKKYQIGNEDNMDDSGNESCPSEYPSTQPKLVGNARAKAGFLIHVDEGDLPDTF
ncbi:hypothetical protein BJ878DRAFT_447768 [Calycina marina]|uniref:Uncharacterized protein n=1 Tax=Calycina marina TaxID=1763456 RepID=A0A9P7YX27_9HELO|nr:hypothetical protein BJ878DRAFT_447768 [Calycina marina]